MPQQEPEERALPCRGLPCHGLGVEGEAAAHGGAGPGSACSCRAAQAEPCGSDMEAAAGRRKQEAGGAIPASVPFPQYPYFPWVSALPLLPLSPTAPVGRMGPGAGGPGSGKGSQCEQLAKRYGFTHLSTSDLLQNELSSLSERSKLIKDIMECGEPVPGGIVLELLKEAMVSKLGDTKGFLIDGYPQELKDAEEFESKIGEPKLVLCLDCSAETIRSQSSESTETTEDRTESYYRASNPLIAYYESKTQLCKVDAEGTQEDVFLEICKTIDSFLKKEEAAFSFPPEMQ